MQLHISGFRGLCRQWDSARLRKQPFQQRHGRAPGEIMPAAHHCPTRRKPDTATGHGILRGLRGAIRELEPDLHKVIVERLARLRVFHSTITQPIPSLTRKLAQTLETSFQLRPLLADLRPLDRALDVDGCDGFHVRGRLPLQHLQRGLHARHAHRCIRPRNSLGQGKEG